MTEIDKFLMAPKRFDINISPIYVCSKLHDVDDVRAMVAARLEYMRQGEVISKTDAGWVHSRRLSRQEWEDESMDFYYGDYENNFGFYQVGRGRIEREVYIIHIEKRSI